VLLLLAELRARRAARNIKLITVAAPLNTPPISRRSFHSHYPKRLMIDKRLADMI
jgi:hypothetical protein